MQAVRSASVESASPGSATPLRCCGDGARLPRPSNAVLRLFLWRPIGQVLDGDGGRTRARTWDPLIKSQLLYQLSYAPGTGASPEEARV